MWPPFGTVGRLSRTNRDATLPAGPAIIADSALTFWQDRLIPVVEIYATATAALAGSDAMIGSRRLGLPVWAGSVIGAAVCIALRLVSVSRGWNLPTASGRQ